MSRQLQYLRSMQIDQLFDSLNEPIYQVQSLMNQIAKEFEWNEEYCPERGEYFEELTKLHQTLAMVRSSMQIAAHLLDEAILISEGDKTAG